MINLILFGAPGSGKGTQSANLVQRYQLMHVSTGDILRAEIKAETELGLKAKTLIEAGHLVADEVIIGMMEDLVASHPDVKGFVFDGFPRTVAQAQALDLLLQRHQTKVSAMLELSVPDEMVIERLLLRKEKEGRSDDNIETINHRLKVYRTQTAPVSEYYAQQGNLHLVDGTGRVEEISDRLYQIIDKLA